MSDESQLQIARKDDESAMVLSSTRSNLVARGLRDAVVLAVLCNKCGERKELVFAACVCASCSDALDKRWAGSTATDWVLIAKQPVEKDGASPWYGISVATYLSVLKHLELLELERTPGSPGVSRKESAVKAATMAVPSSGRKKLWPPLEWLNAPSPDAELFGLEDGEGFCSYVYPNTTYAQMKLHWAKSDPTGNLVTGAALPEDRSNLPTKLAEYLHRIGVTSEQIEAIQETESNGEMSEASRAQWGKWWQAATEGHIDIRPAKLEETVTHNALLRDQKRHEHTARILEKWGFDTQGAPLAGSIDDDEWERRGLRAWEEIRRTFEGLGLLKGSLFDYEEELRASFVR